MIAPSPYRLRAFNTATASSNKIHDDAVARGFGYRGGLVPGVDVFAYLCHVPAERWGERWLGGGTLAARFRSPVYDGDDIAVVGEPDGDGALELSLRGPDHAVRATGRATLPDEAAGAPDLDVGKWPAGPVPDVAPPVAAAVLQAVPLGSIAATFRVDRAQPYLDDIREQLQLFRDGGYAHPGWLLRFANSILVANVTLGPWIHTQSELQLLGLVRDGDRVETRARVRRLHERRGHELVDLDVLQLVDGKPVSRIAHTAIYRLRPTGS